MSGGMKNISVSDCDFTQTETGLNIKYSAYRGGYVEDVRAMRLLHSRALILKSQLRLNAFADSLHKHHHGQPRPCGSHREFELRLTQSLLQNAAEGSLPCEYSNRLTSSHPCCAARAAAFVLLAEIDGGWDTVQVNTITYTNITQAPGTSVKVRTTPSWPRSWANFSLL